MSDVATVQPSGLLTFIERAARDPQFDINKFEALLRMQREAEHDQQRRAFNAAMAAAQAEMLHGHPRQPEHLPPAANTPSWNTSSRRCGRSTSAHGFSVRYGLQRSSSQPGHIRLVATVAHTGGYSEEVALEAPVSSAGSQGGKTAMTPVQALGSATTYLRRYLASLIWNVTLVDEDDDDGEMGRTARAPRPRPEPAAAAPADPLDEPNGPKWLQNLELMLANAQDVAEVERIGGSVQVRRVMESAAPQSGQGRDQPPAGDALRAVCRPGRSRRSGGAVMILIALIAFIVYGGCCCCGGNDHDC